MAWQQQLLKWYDQYKRDLPWRRQVTPYRVWISEIMLQQTTVKTVIPYYQNFLKQFPSMKALAQASSEAVLSAWAGLGYYSRARNLHKAAQKCVAEMKGRLPRTPDELVKLPGIGPYTAGAIASIAYDEIAPIVDGNVARVLSRLYALEADPKTNQGIKVYWQHAEQILPDKRCGDFNQALMELGATLCTPSRPNCLLCPVQSSCQLLKQNKDPMTYPMIAKRPEYRRVALTTVLLQNNNHLWMIQRPEQGALRDMWEFPTLEGDIEELAEAFSLKLKDGQKLRQVKHSIMNQRITVEPWLFDVSRDQTPKIGCWVPTSSIETLPISSMISKILRNTPKSK